MDDVPPDPSSPPESATGAMGALTERSITLVQELDRVYREQVERSLEVTLDHSVESLAFVDHHLAQAREETRGPILSLLAAGGGAYFGEVVRRQIGAHWIGDGRDPARLRLLLEHQLVHFSPIDQAHEAILSVSPDDGDTRSDGRVIDGSFQFVDHHRAPLDATEVPEAARQPDGAWVADRLAELSPLPAEEFFSLTGRFETLKVILEMLAMRHASEGREPRRHGAEDYLAALADHM